MSENKMPTKAMMMRDGYTTIKVSELEELQSQLSTALSERSAYREALEEIKDFLDHGAADYAHEVVKKSPRPWAGGGSEQRGAR